MTHPDYPLDILNKPTAGFLLKFVYHSAVGLVLYAVLSREIADDWIVGPPGQTYRPINILLYRGDWDVFWCLYAFARLLWGMCIEIGFDGVSRKEMCGHLLLWDLLSSVFVRYLVKAGNTDLWSICAMFAPLLGLVWLEFLKLCGSVIEEVKEWHRENSSAATGKAKKN
jgi:hypothetical protein